ncbi:hypothetical protein AB6A40_002751 [Gnathostoma spinigerum]|uniref:Uncharacterized protein n=1 Tax=Gnathostoma spinigerum TaxID=75299 RepID=A0ABD6EHK3_9BILA
MKGVIIVLFIGLTAVFYCVALNCYEGQIIFIGGKELNGTTKQPEVVKCPIEEKFCSTVLFKEGRFKDSRGQLCADDDLCTKNGCYDESKIVDFKGIHEKIAMKICCCSTDLCNSSNKLRYDCGVVVSVITAITLYSFS